MAEREPNRLRDDRYAALETALSACQEELARCKVHAERADEARHAADHGRASEFKRAQAAETALDDLQSLAHAYQEVVGWWRAAEAARDELARVLQDVVDMRPDAIEDLRRARAFLSSEATKGET